MNISKHSLRIPVLLLVASLATGCATNPVTLADGRNVRDIMAAQIEEPGASDRHGNAAPQGTDPEVSATSVRALRQRSSESGSKPGLLEAVFGALAGK